MTNIGKMDSLLSRLCDGEMIPDSEFASDPETEAGVPTESEPNQEQGKIPWALAEKEVPSVLNTFRKVTENPQSGTHVEDKTAVLTEKRSHTLPQHPPLPHTHEQGGPSLAKGPSLALPSCTASVGDGPSGESVGGRDTESLLNCGSKVAHFYYEPRAGRRKVYEAQLIKKWQYKNRWFGEVKYPSYPGQFCKVEIGVDAFPWSDWLLEKSESPSGYLKQKLGKGKKRKENVEDESARVQSFWRKKQKRGGTASYHCSNANSLHFVGKSVQKLHTLDQKPTEGYVLFRTNSFAGTKKNGPNCGLDALNFCIGDSNLVKVHDVRLTAKERNETTNELSFPIITQTLKRMKLPFRLKQDKSIKQSALTLLQKTQGIFLFRARVYGSTGDTLFHYYGYDSWRRLLFDNNSVQDQRYVVVDDADIRSKETANGLMSNIGCHRILEVYVVELHAKRIAQTSHV